MGLIFTLSGDRFSSTNTLGKLAWFAGWLWPRLPLSFLEALNWCIRKGAHLTVYLILSLLMAPTLDAWQSRSRALPYYTFGFCVLFAFTDEIHQSYTTTRTPSLGDVLLDALGVLAGLGIYLWIKRVQGVKGSRVQGKR